MLPISLLELPKPSRTLGKRQKPLIHNPNFYITCLVLKYRCLAFSQGPGGFRELREAYRNHFHRSWYLSDAVVTNYSKKPSCGNICYRARCVLPLDFLAEKTRSQSLLPLSSPLKGPVSFFFFVRLPYSPLSGSIGPYTILTNQAGCSIPGIWRPVLVVKF